MTAFNVLDRKQQVHRHALIEASAGTGKTFAIENIVVRLLTETHGDDPPLSLEKILVVTFTRAATSDLKKRIRSNLEQALNIYKHYINTGTIDNCPDYLLAHLEKGVSHVKTCRRYIEQALFSFDQAQIFTIHGFCWRMLKNFSLEGGVSLETSSSEEKQPLVKARLLQVIRDFLRTEINNEAYSISQLRLLLKRADGQIEKLESKLLQAISRGIPILSPPSFHDLLKDFQASMLSLKTKLQLESQKIIEDFHTQVPLYTGLCNRSKQVHPEVMQKIERFAALFDKKNWDADDFDMLIADGLFIVEALNLSKLSKKAGNVEAKRLHYPQLLDEAKKALECIIHKAAHETSLFARLASDCQRFVQRYQREEEMLDNNDLLMQMNQAIGSPSFAHRVSQAFRAAIVDEFQDTDPIQWEIFSSLFANPNQPWNGYLYLVGDPKQSIYAFRQADIYTYLNAADRLGNDAMATLDTNFRSQPKLIDALNLVFSSVEGLFPLPRRGETLPFRPVKAGRQNLRAFNDNEAPLQFWTVPSDGKAKKSFKAIEENYFLPAIVKEILHLKCKENVPFGQIALLVSDRYQAERVSTFLKEREIRVRSQRGEDLAKSIAVESMREIINGILHYHQRSLLKIALAGRIIGMTHEEMKRLHEGDLLAAILHRCEKLRDLLVNQGFSQFYMSLMQSVWHPSNQTISELMLSHKGSETFYRQWQDVADLLMAEQAASKLSAEGLITFLDEFESLAKYEDERIRCYLDPDEEGISIITTHVSKGLEFDVVFALGLITRPKISEEDLILIQEGSKIYLSAAAENDEAYQKHCQELDAEKMRQLYVAMTRAKYRLYLPAILPLPDEKIPSGCASPMELLLARLNLESLVTDNIQVKILDEAHSEEAAHFQTEIPTVIAPAKFQIPGTPCQIQSFTSLTQGKSHAPADPAEILQPPHDFNAAIKNRHTLPSGNETGILLHLLLETISFDVVKGMKDAKGLLPMIHPMVQNGPFAEWTHVIADILFDTLKTSIGSFCLADIDPKKIYRETEFLFPCEESSLDGDISSRQGFVKGVIDLFFEHRGKYYLLDWKSNWLGPTIDHYHPKYLHEAMRTNFYDVQAKLYVQALRRYLGIFGIDFESSFGGVYYLFLRGVTTTTGIHLGMGA